MEDTTTRNHDQALPEESGVVRRFSPVRIERMLLTRLFDLTTGQALADFDEQMASSVAAEFPAETRRRGRKEAA
jgi:hypothetical protein